MKKQRNSRIVRRLWERPYSLPPEPQKHASTSMAIAWGRLAARLGWELEPSLNDEVELEYHVIARNAYQERRAWIVGRD